jgi:hypothetical protein
MELFYLHRCGNLKSASVFVSHVWIYWDQPTPA